MIIYIAYCGRKIKLYNYIRKVASVNNNFKYICPVVYALTAGMVLMYSFPTIPNRMTDAPHTPGCHSLRRLDLLRSRRRVPDNQYPAY